MTQDELSPRYAGEIVASCATAIFHGAHTLVNIPGLIKRIVQEDLWAHYERTDGMQEFTTFPEFVEKGLGTNIASLQHLCRDDNEALDVLDRAVVASPGRPRKNVDNVNIIRRPTGNSASQAIRRLRRDRPDLHARVITGELSPNEAMLAAGWRRKRISMFVGDPDRAARLLKRHFSQAEISKIKALLEE